MAPWVLALCWVSYSALATGQEQPEATPIPNSYEAIFTEQVMILESRRETLRLLENQLATALEQSRRSTTASRAALTEFRKLRLLVSRLRQHLWLQQGMADHLKTKIDASSRSLATASSEAERLGRKHARERFEAGLTGFGLGVAVGAGAVLAVFLLTG